MQKRHCEVVAFFSTIVLWSLKIQAVWSWCPSHVKFPAGSASSTSYYPGMARWAFRNPDDALTSAAPLYITIGPQCCGKTTQLRNLHPNLVDVSLDDQPDVYVPVPTECFLRESASEEFSALLQTQYQGKTLRERIESPENLELRLILARWNGSLSPQRFAVDILQIYQARNATHVAQVLIKVVEAFLEKDSPALPQETHVFVLESLFRPHPETNRTAIQRAHERLRQTPPHVPLAWGNTNSKSRDYQNALEIACQARRPVRFLICAPPSAVGDEQGLPVPPHIPWSSLSVLFLRSLRRLARTGRYIPGLAIADCCDRVEELVGQAASSSSKPISPFSIEERLVSLSIPQTRDRRPARYRYEFSTQRLICKQFLEPRSDNRNQRPYSSRPERRDDSRSYPPKKRHRSG